VSVRAAPARFDVVVAGGGSAGFAAAMSAARCGARTLLCERSDVLGGNVGNAFVHSICGLYRSADEGEVRHAHAGFPRAFAEALRASGGAGEVERAGRVYVLPIEPPRFAGLVAGWCARRPGLELAIGCELVGAQLAREPRGEHALTLRTREGGVREILASVAIDATGDATLAALGGAEVAAAAPGELQLPSLIVRLGGVDASDLTGFSRLRLTHAIAGAVRAHALPGGCESVLVRRAAAPDEVYLTLNVPRPAGVDYAPLEPGALAALEADARERARDVAGFLRSSRPEFARSRIVAWPRRLGVRETRRLRGRLDLSRADVLEGRAHADEVAISSWPIELWHDHRRALFEYPQGACAIPLGALVSRSHPRLGTAGRCLSASHEALGALRVVGTALATGEAIGIAAACAADRGVELAAIPARDVRARILALAGEALP